jgi:hypothetical protein
MSVSSSAVAHAGGVGATEPALGAIEPPMPAVVVTTRGGGVIVGGGIGSGIEPAAPTGAGGTFAPVPPPPPLIAPFEGVASSAEHASKHRLNPNDRPTLTNRISSSNE